jgi:hypothetical protein
VGELTYSASGTSQDREQEGRFIPSWPLGAEGHVQEKGKETKGRLGASGDHNQVATGQ